MTAIRERRRRSTVLSLAAALAGLVAAAVLGVAGARSLADSTAGEQAAGQAVVLPTQRLPHTATALVGVVDDTGRLTSVAAMVLEPDGVGGAIVVIAATADAGSGTFDTLSPLAAVYDASGPEDFLAAVERLTGLSFDVVEVVDPPRFAQLVNPLGDVSALFETAFVDASSGEQWEPGEVSLSAPGAARAITAADPDVADWVYESPRAAVWKAITERVGAGVGSAAPVASDDDVPIPRTLDEFLDRLFAGPVAERALTFTPIAKERVDTQLLQPYVGALGSVDAVVAHDRAELAIVFGALAPARLGAPLDAPVFRVVSPFGEADFAGLDLNEADVLKRALDRLFFAQVNVVSVAALPTVEVPESTTLVVADPGTIDAVIDVYEPLFGEVDVVPADVLIDGVDIEVTLGRNFLTDLRGESAPGVAGSGADDEPDDDEPTAD